MAQVPYSRSDLVNIFFFSLHTLRNALYKNDVRPHGFQAGPASALVQNIDDANMEPHLSCCVILIYN